MKNKLDKSNTLKIFGNNVKRERLRIGLSQEQLAEQINKSSHFVSLIERGQTAVSFSTIIDICKELKIDSNAIFKDIIPSSDTIMLNNTINTFNRNDKDMVEYLINYIVESKK